MNKWRHLLNSAGLLGYERGLMFSSGYQANLAVIVQDAECFARHLSQTHGIPLENMSLLAHSVGAAIAAHLGKLGIEVLGDGGLLFALALTTLAASLVARERLPEAFNRA